MREGSLGVAIVARQVVVFQATRSHKTRERFLDVSTFRPFGSDRVFLATNSPKARIKTSDILTIFPPTDVDRTQTLLPGSMLQLPEEAVTEFYLLSARQQDRYEKLWNAWAKEF
ncbi:Capping protein [Mycena indigotica]|uniref:Capping protein n=1 Tax=Mycena indigotica TaxID=2126181 RepID=A0A8H6T0W2_9AGAR|nr:Capping protein [Mycena indigotica]KAF7309643.1 Capping protein [Mycena indigotica]